MEVLNESFFTAEYGRAKNLEDQQLVLVMRQ